MSTFQTVLISVVGLMLAFPVVAETSDQAAIAYDVVDAAYVHSRDELVVIGRNGLIGVVPMNEGALVLYPLAGIPDEDFTAVEALSSGTVLVGSSKGVLYRLSEGELERVALLSDFEEPILDIAVDDSAIWVVGARGLIARSVNGVDWEIVEIEAVTQTAVSSTALTGELYFGVANIVEDSLQLVAKVAGRPAEVGRDYDFFADEGFLQITTEFDATPMPSIAFEFVPGPPFRPGDVTWNTVIVQNNHVLLAGEFGLILHSEDGGSTWTRRNGRVTSAEPQLPYWMSGAVNDEVIVLVGAAGVVYESPDMGISWQALESPGEEGIFGVAFDASGFPIVAGAVGLAGRLGPDGWELADRTALQLLSWLKSPVSLPDGSLIILGGRSTALMFRDGQWHRRVFVRH